MKLFLLMRLLALAEIAQGIVRFFTPIRPTFALSVAKRIARERGRWTMACNYPPPGWRCTFNRGHRGPCRPFPKWWNLRGQAWHHKNSRA